MRVLPVCYIYAMLVYAMLRYLYMPSARRYLQSLCTATVILSDQQYTLEMLLSSPLTSLLP